MGIIEVIGISSLSGALIGGAVVWTIKRLINGTLEQNAELLGLVTKGISDNTLAVSKLTSCIDSMKRVDDERHRVIMHTLDRIDDKG